MTTFISPQATREAIAALYTAYSGSGQPLERVFSNWPKVGEAKGLSPFLMVVDDFTEQDMAGLNTNPTQFGFVIAVFVLSGSPTDTTINRADAADELGNINRLIRQVIRDNAGNANWDSIRFEGRATVKNINFEDLPYMIQDFHVVTKLAHGAI